MKQLLQAALALLGISAFHSENGKRMFTDEQRTKLEASLGKETLTKLEASLNSESTDAEAAEKMLGLEAELSQFKSKQAELESQLATERSDKEAIKTQKTELEGRITQQEQAIRILSKKPEEDPYATHVPPSGDDPTNDKFLFGIEQPMYAIDNKHSYNQRAYAAVLEKSGQQVIITNSAAMDYSSLTSDLGDFYRIRKQEQIQSFLQKLPSLEALFPLESGYQDRAVLVNIFLDEFSQADNTSSTFDNVVKGGYKFEPEELRMFDVMFAYTFTKLKELEKSWIGYLNREGSSTMKWSFIQFILVETGKKLHNERELRRIGGKRVNPTLNVQGAAMGASDGLYTFIKKQIDLFKIKTFDDLGALTPHTISNYIYEATGRIPAVYRDSGKLCLYMPSKLITLYHKNNETLYGLNQDYQKDIMYVKEYPSVCIEEIKNADNYGRLIWTMNGNISLFEDKPGEMYNFQLEQKDWSLKVWSNWKESIWAYFVGKKFASAGEQDYDHQMIFCNNLHLNPEYYLPLNADDTSPSVLEHNHVISVGNTVATAITNFDDVTVGEDIYIKCGNATNAVTIAKSGNFSLLSAAWTPSVGDILHLKKRSDGKFIEIERIPYTAEAIAFDADDATPSVADGTIFITNANANATAITTLDDAIEGVVYKIYGAGTTHASTIANSGNFSLTAAMTLSTGTFIELQKVGAKFYEITRG